MQRTLIVTNADPFCPRPVLHGDRSHHVTTQHADTPRRVEFTLLLPVIGAPENVLQEVYVQGFLNPDVQAASEK